MMFGKLSLRLNLNNPSVQVRVLVPAFETCAGMPER
jgi:hypothetical protein